MRKPTSPRPADVRRARNLQILAALDAGLSCRQVAGLYGLSASRVSQIRRELAAAARR